MFNLYFVNTFCDLIHVMIISCFVCDVRVGATGWKGTFCEQRDAGHRIEKTLWETSINRQCCARCDCKYKQCSMFLWMTVDIWAVFTYTVPLNCPLCSINHLRRQTAEYDYLLILELGKLPLAIFRFTNGLFPLRQHFEILKSCLANIWI